MKKSADGGKPSVLDLVLLENMLLCTAMHLVYTSPRKSETDKEYDKFLHWIKEKVGENAAGKFSQMADINRLYTKNRNQKIKEIRTKSLLPARFFTQELGGGADELIKKLHLTVTPHNKAHAILQIIMRFYINAQINPNFNLDTVVETNLKDFPQITLLGFAALIRSPFLVMDLFDKGASYKIQFIHSPLRASVKNNFPELTDWLLEKKYYLLTDENIYELYNLCIEHGFQGCLEAMIKHKFFGNLISDENPLNDRNFMISTTGFICQQLCADSSNANVLKKMFATLCQAGFRVDGRDPEGKSCFLIALLLKCPDIFELLMTHGKIATDFLNIVYHIPDFFDGTLLTAAAKLDLTYCLRLLLRAGSNPNLPLQPTMHRPYAKILPWNDKGRKLLLEYHAEPIETGIRLDFGSDKNKPKLHSQRPLIDAIISSSPDGVRTALQHGDSPNLTQDDNNSPLGYVLLSYSNSISPQHKKIQFDILRLLLEKGADINAPLDHNLKSSSLVFICTYDLSELIPLVLQYRADIHFRHPAFLSAFQMCCHEANIATLTMIAKHSKGMLYQAVDDFFFAAYMAIMNHQYLMIHELIRYFDFENSDELEKKFSGFVFDAILKFHTLGQIEKIACRNQLDSMVIGIGWRFKIGAIKAVGEIVEQSLTHEKLDQINNFLNAHYQTDLEFQEFIRGSNDFIDEMQLLLSAESEIQEKWRAEVVLALQRFSEARSLKVEWHCQQSRFYGCCLNVHENNKLLDLFQKAGISVQSSEKFVTLQIMEPNRKYITALCDLLMHTEQVVEVATSSNQTGFAYLTNFFGSVQRVKEFQEANAQNKIATPASVLIATEPTIITWANRLIQSTDSEIQHLTNLDHYVLYSKELMTNQGCSPEIYKCLSQILAAGSERNACLKRLKGQMPAVTIQIGTQVFSQLPITLEARNKSLKERFVLAPLLSDCKRYILYISVFYLSNGLHETKDLAQLTERCQQAVLIPWEKPTPDPQCQPTYHGKSI